jgi:hypothetical protein
MGYDSHTGNMRCLADLERSLWRFPKCQLDSRLYSISCICSALLSPLILHIHIGATDTINRQIIFSSIAAAMTIYLSSSESVYSTKDETAPAPTQSPFPYFHSSSPTSSPAKSTDRIPTYGSVENGGASATVAAEHEDPSPPMPSLAIPAKKRKVMYFAAGSGIPEIKTILSGEE